MMFQITRQDTSGTYLFLPAVTVWKSMIDYCKKKKGVVYKI